MKLLATSILQLFQATSIVSGQPPHDHYYELYAPMHASFSQFLASW